MSRQALVLFDISVSTFTRQGGRKRPYRLAQILPAVERLVPAARRCGHRVLWVCDVAALPSLVGLRGSDRVLGHEDLAAALEGVERVVVGGVLSSVRAFVSQHPDAVVVEDALAADGGGALRGGRAALGAVPASTVLTSWKDVRSGIGAGDSSIHHGLVCEEGLLDAVRDEIRWEEMRHRGGVVPRQIAVQASMDDGRTPIYRHPADEHPAVRPWTPVVDRLRRAVEACLGQPINHALIQRYPDRIANISLHADKTLDVARGSTIVNLSLGATRTMLLQHKVRSADGSFVTERVPLPHGSLFALGWETNRVYRHGVRPDRRGEIELLSDERVHGGERISLTFRTISTFLRDGVVEGQGACAHTSRSPREESRQMLIAFGRENRDAEFDWEQHYGGGFACLAIRDDG